MGPFDKFKDAFKKVGNDIKKSNDNIASNVKKSNNSIGNSFKSIPKPKIDMKALQTATGIIAGIVSLTPIGKAMVMSATTIADSQTHGAASAYLNNGHKTNGTLSMLPGGMLAQSIANDATNGRSRDTLNRFVPDPKTMIISDVKSASHTVISNPKSTLTVFKNNFTPVRPTITSIMAPVFNIMKPIRSDITRPPLFQPVIPEAITINSVQSPPTTISKFLSPSLEIVAPISPSITINSVQSIPISTLPTISSSIVAPPVESMVSDSSSSILPIVGVLALGLLIFL